MANSSANLALTHQDLRVGWSQQVPLDLQHPWKPALAEAIARASQNRGTAFQAAGTSFLVETNVEHQADGNLSFSVANAGPLATCNLPPGRILYTACVACQVTTAPLAWRFIRQQYLNQMLGSDRKSVV